MRRLIEWALIGAAGLALCAGALAVVLVAGQPLAAGQAAFTLQHALTERALRLVSDPTTRAEYRLALLDRRLDDLREQAGTPHGAAAYRAYDAALHAAVEAVAAAPRAEQSPLRNRLRLAAERLRALLPQLRSLAEADPPLYAAASVKAATLLHLLRAETEADHASAAPVDLALGEGRPIPFPPNATPGAHDLFPLTGQHTLAECAACHTDGRYQGTPAACTQCHAPERPPEHFAGACVDCHSPAAWSPASFDHAGVTDCAGCHLDERPVPHYAGQCSLCHHTSGWQGARFNHAVIGGTDCAACHAPPPNHFSGTCSGCHTDTRNFRSATFTHSFPLNHAGANGNCMACHPGGNTRTYTCAHCHAPERMADKHDEVGGFGANCVACHADGREVDD